MGFTAMAWQIPLTQLAAQRNFTLPTAPSPFQQAVIDQLSPLSGIETDSATDIF